LAVFFLSFFECLLVIAEKSARVEEGLTMMNKGINTAGKIVTNISIIIAIIQNVFY